MKKSFVIIKSFIITHLFILLLPLSLLSQTPLIKPSWDLRLIEDPAPGPQSCIYTNIIETDEGFYVVPLLHIDEYRNGKDDCADIIVINRDGEVMKEILLEYDENYIVNKIVLVKARPIGTKPWIPNVIDNGPRVVSPPMSCIS